MCHNEAEIHAGTNFLSVTLNPVKNRSIILTVSRLWHITEDLKSHCLNADPEKEARGGRGCQNRLWEHWGQFREYLKRLFVSLTSTEFQKKIKKKTDRGSHCSQLNDMSHISLEMWGVSTLVNRGVGVCVCVETNLHGATV